MPLKFNLFFSIKCLQEIGFYVDLAIWHRSGMLFEILNFSTGAVGNELSKHLFTFEVE